MESIDHHTRGEPSGAANSPHVGDPAAHESAVIDNIQRAKSEWEAVIDAQPELIIALDRHGRILRANRTIEKWELGTVASARGLQVHEIFHPDCHNEHCLLQQRYAAAFRQIRSGNVESWRYRDPQYQREFEYRLYPPAPLKSTTPADASTESDLLRLLVVRPIAERAAFHDMATPPVASADRTASEQPTERTASASAFELLEAERQRIARDLHDAVGQSLCHIKFKLEQLGIELAHEDRIALSIEKLVEFVRRAQIDVRNLSTDLRPSMLDDLGLLSTIEWFCSELQSTYPAIEFNSSLRISENDIPESLKLPIYRVLQEALQNAIKHANARMIIIELLLLRNRIHLNIVDDGVGFELESQKNDNHINGLSNMRHRALDSGGNLMIDSHPGQGFKVRASWPLRQSIR